MSTDTLPTFTNALLALGATDIERAKALGVPRRTFMDYKAGRLPLGMRRLLRSDLMRALLADLEHPSTIQLSTKSTAKSCTVPQVSSPQT